ncbi:NAD(P)H dehydrogenase (quinone) [Filimonas lacunae]|uniref:NAD(P)H dehydrogenase (Quinone) n=1 Tax=Filimonas lacunae TaxID=477680 RepID=A0A173MIH5_9BACT|nr:NAD(P)H-dependent oxidoreductase [Filimonas lacunae]BAV07433.1 NAD(P)H oxidoreductase YRKL [Filimonas lacunae]SIT30390.1 NAD(P)H dehydrogenase (quinone) [Filimonas lacunae]
MKVLIVLAHPEPLSMNGALFNKAIETLEAAGHEVKTSNLYAMKFDPISDRRNFSQQKNEAFFKQQLEELYAVEQENGFAPDLESEQQKVEWCDLMIWQFPLWWFSVPGILKGWIDRIFAMGRFYGQGKIYEQGVFKGKKALLSLTTGSPETAYQPGGLHGNIQNILKPIQRGIFEFTGFSPLTPHVTYQPSRISAEERAIQLNNWEQRLKQIFDEKALATSPY